MEHRRDLDARVRLALIYAESPIVALRHHAPVGHFFGVPSFAEIAEAWQRHLGEADSALGGRRQSAARSGPGSPARRTTSRCPEWRYWCRRSPVTR